MLEINVRIISLFGINFLGNLLWRSFYHHLLFSIGFQNTDILNNLTLRCAMEIKLTAFLSDFCNRSMSLLLVWKIRNLFCRGKLSSNEKFTQHFWRVLQKYGYIRENNHTSENRLLLRMNTQIPIKYLSQQLLCNYLINFSQPKKK